MARGIADEANFRYRTGLDGSLPQRLFGRNHDVRKRMDEGNWSALMKGWKQVYNSVDFSECKEDNEKSDDIMLHWLADIYTYWQWRYNLSSKEISARCDARLLSQLYYPLHETSIQNACEKLQKRFFTKKNAKEFEKSITETMDEIRKAIKKSETTE